MELLHFILAAYGMTFIIIHGHIFNKIRPPCKSMGGFGRLFHCHLCMGFWVGVFLWGVSPYTELFSFSNQAMIPDVLKKASDATALSPNIMFDGGVCLDNIQEVLATNPKSVVIGGGLFSQPADRQRKLIAQIRDLRD